MKKINKLYEFKKTIGMFKQSLELNDDRYMRKSMLEILSSDKKIEKNVWIIVRAISGYIREKQIKQHRKENNERVD